MPVVLELDLDLDLLSRLNLKRRVLAIGMRTLT